MESRQKYIQRTKILPLVLVIPKIKTSAEKSQGAIGKFDQTILPECRLILHKNIFSFCKKAQGFPATFSTDTRVLHTAKRGS